MSTIIHPVWEELTKLLHDTLLEMWLMVGENLQVGAVLEKAAPKDDSIN